MSGIWLALADFFANHSIPTIAGFFGGIVGGIARDKVIQWRKKK